ncbi:RNA pyrophosphohydrolase [Candidatus Woesearchaeota archaeon]|nr:MAG: RNA pyrophosphohydrolase [Candidatus Woesearchaeota archaeon]
MNDCVKGIDYPGVSVVFVCHDGKGNYLFNKRSVNCRDEHGRWDCGAGGLDLGLSIEETLKKEIMEEYCTKVLDFEFIGYRDVFREHDGKKTHWLMMDFLVLVDREKVKIGEPHKMDEIGWFKIGNLPSPTHSQWPAYYNKYKEKLGWD